MPAQLRRLPAAAFHDADFAFYGKALGGKAQQLPRQRAESALDRRMGDPLGKLYVAKYFPPEAKAKVRRWSTI